MGLRSRLRKVVDKLSGEYSAAAPEEIEPFERNVDPADADADKVVKAKLVRPRDRNAKKGDE